MNPDWDDAAKDELADIWVTATPEERDEIEKAVLRANRELADDPEVGESRDGNSRVHFVPPLTLWYRVMPDSRARVVSVRRHKKKK